MIFEFQAVVIKQILNSHNCQSLNFDACTANGSFKYNDALLQEMLEHGNVVDSCLFTKNECGDILKDETRCLHLRYHYEMVHLRMIFELQRLTSTKVKNSCNFIVYIVLFYSFFYLLLEP